MKIIQTTDIHFKQEEPYFRAGVALFNFILDHLRSQVEPFIYLDSGDLFHVSKETGRVNREVVKFFLQMATIPNCYFIYVMQGNHDVKEETGSALDLLRGLDVKIKVVDTPCFPSIPVENTSDIKTLTKIYLLPHMKPFSIPNYSGVKSYGDDNFHREYWKSQNIDWDEVKEGIKFVSVHGGDETTGKFFMNVDLSIIPGIRSNGHVHKQVSKNQLTSASVTRRDEIDKKCFIRHINTDNWEVSEIEIPLFLNYAQIPYGEDIDGYFESSIHLKPKESLIVDIFGHDDAKLVISEYEKKWADCQSPKLYIGEVSPVERRGEAVIVEERDDLDISSINIKELFQEFCEEKKLAKSIVEDLMSRID